MIRCSTAILPDKAEHAEHDTFTSNAITPSFLTTSSCTSSPRCGVVPNHVWSGRRCYSYISTTRSVVIVGISTTPAQIFQI
eukprot:6492806-Amphidinium_carterae.4